MQTIDGWIPRALPPAFYKTYRLAAPLATHWRPVTCEEAGCEQYLNGWWSHCDETTETGRAQAYFIRKKSGRRFTEYREDPDDAPAELRGRHLTFFWFPPGQDCFARSQHEWPEGREGRRHVVRNDRPEQYLVRGGDYRGNPTGERRVHQRPQDWVEDFASHQLRLKTLLERG